MMDFNIPPERVKGTGVEFFQRKMACLKRKLTPVPFVLLGKMEEHHARNNKNI